MASSKVDHCFDGSSLLTSSQKKKLNEFYGINGQRWKLIYKASRDSFDMQAFHRHCDDIGPTMTVVQSKDGYLFGGYTSVPWASALGSQKNDPTAFLFTLVSPVVESGTKFACIKAGTNAVFHSFSCGPAFGTGYDLIISNDSDTNMDSYCNFPHSYVDHLGHGTLTFTGSVHFKTADIEVFTQA
ncbi:unnamed protein product [Didymodactylos carnosus]|uniref:TLDc domain-containing protein n=2 Tax=Didymodactylos carnosus TaxID=1234261 RepID=A0A814CH58_9BILA|nr:unnamed protein product [Didymodactylos carnosus]CAF3717842.1 unnamed protein product [Didymodactylos carnosus]